MWGDKSNNPAPLCAPSQHTEIHNNPMLPSKSSNQVRDVNTILDFNEAETKILNKLDEVKQTLSSLLSNQHTSNTISTHLYSSLSDLWIIPESFTKLPSNLKIGLEESDLTEDKTKNALAVVISRLSKEWVEIARLALDINIHDTEWGFLPEFKKRLSELVDFIKQESDKL